MRKKPKNQEIGNYEKAKETNALSSTEVFASLSGYFVNRRRGMREAWERSETDDPIKRHEEGGYIVLSPDRNLQTLPWPRGERGLIEMHERDADGKYKGFYVVSSYHTHPNPPVDEKGRRWEQSPSEIDIETIRREKYSGDSFVISNQTFL